VSSVSSAADVKVPFLSPIRCGLSSSFFQVTVVPAVTVSVAGAKAKLSILTVAGLAAAARLCHSQYPRVAGPGGAGPRSGSPLVGRERTARRPMNGMLL
jgi:hypothetical protein